MVNGQCRKKGGAKTNRKPLRRQIKCLGKYWLNLAGEKGDGVK